MLLGLLRVGGTGSKFAFMFSCSYFLRGVPVIIPVRVVGVSNRFSLVMVIAELEDQKLSFDLDNELHLMHRVHARPQHSNQLILAKSPPYFLGFMSDFHHHWTIQDCTVFVLEVPEADIFNVASGPASSM